MKNILFAFIAILCFSNTSIGQNSSTLTIFSEDGHPFTLLLNGLKQNETPAANVKAEDLIHEYYSVKVNFDKKSLKSVEQKELVVRGADGGNVDAMYVLRKYKKGKFRLELYSVLPIEPTPVPVPEATAVVTKKKVKKSVEESVEPKKTTEVNKKTTEASFKEGSVWEEEMKEEMDSKGLEADAMAMLKAMEKDLEANSDGKDVQVVTDVDVKVVGDTKTTTTTTTTITKIGGFTQKDVHIDVMTETVKKGRVRNSLDNKTPANTGCRGAELTDLDFADSKKNIAEKTSESDKLRIAKQITSIACLTTEQVREIMLLFSQDVERLAYAKYAYERTSDARDYRKVYDAFDDPKVSRELDEFIGK